MGVRSQEGYGVLEDRLNCIKYTLFCFSVILLVLGAGMIFLSVDNRFEESFSEWVEYLDIGAYYIGVDILIVAAVIVVITSIVGIATITENPTILYAHAGLQIFAFVLSIVGLAVLKGFSSYGSSIQGTIRASMTNLISNSQHDHISQILKTVQESVGCCGAQGPRDYTDLLKPLPNECRSTVTGNSYFQGCVDELTWFLETRSEWLIDITYILCIMNMVQAALSLVLVQGKQKLED